MTNEGEDGEDVGLRPERSEGRVANMGDEARNGHKA